MKNLLVFLFMLLPLTGCFAQTQQVVNSTEQEQNKNADPYTWDFGLVKKNVLVSHDFEIKNNLERVLTIKNVSTSCGCTASSAKKNTLEPGEGTQVAVEFNSKGYNGQVSQFVYVNTDDQDNPIQKFTIKALVQ